MKLSWNWSLRKLISFYYLKIAAILAYPWGQVVLKFGVYFLMSWFAFGFVAIWCGNIFKLASLFFFFLFLFQMLVWYNRIKYNFWHGTWEFMEEMKDNYCDFEIQYYQIWIFFIPFFPVTQMYGATNIWSLVNAQWFFLRIVCVITWVLICI